MIKILKHLLCVVKTTWWANQQLKSQGLVCKINGGKHNSTLIYRTKSDMLFSKNAQQTNLHQQLSHRTNYYYTLFIQTANTVSGPQALRISFKTYRCNANITARHDNTKTVSLV